MSISYNNKRWASEFRARAWPRQADWDGQETLCDHCVKQVFTPYFFSKITSLWHRDFDPESQTHRYHRPLQDVYISSQAGCPWCHSMVCAMWSVTSNMKSTSSKQSNLRWGGDEPGLQKLLNSDNVLEVEIKLSYGDVGQDCRFIAQVKCQTSASLEEVWITFRLNTGFKSSPDNSLEVGDPQPSSLFPRLDDEFDFTSEACFVGIKSFFHQCYTHHNGHNPLTRVLHGKNTTKSPARLIKISTVGKCRIVEQPDQGWPAPYTTLSYVWGDNQSFMLTKENMTKFLVGLDVEAVPNVISQAIQATRRLGFTLLWVDALCIVQDSDEDKLRELAKMHEIYKSSALTIVAAYTNSAWDDFLRISLRAEHNTGFVLSPFNIVIQLAGNDLAPISFRAPSIYLGARDPLNRRAWTLQEHLMSNHLVIFAHDGVELVCKELSASKIQDHGHIPSTISTVSRVINTQSQNPLNLWYRVRGKYTGRNLSRGEDKLIAIAALAKEISHLFTGRYLAGLWEQWLLAELLWFAPHEKKPRPQVYRAPSWSWAACDSYIITSSPNSSSAFRNCHVNGCSVTLKSEQNPYGAVTSGELELVAVWRTCGLIPHSTNWPDRYSADVQVEGPFNGDVRMDTHNERHFDQSSCVTFGAIHSYGKGDKLVEGLVLEAVDDGTHRRIGYFDMMDAAVFDGFFEKTFTII